MNCNVEHCVRETMDFWCCFVFSPIKTKGQIAWGIETVQVAKCSAGLGPYLVVAHMV